MRTFRTDGSSSAPPRRTATRRRRRPVVTASAIIGLTLATFLATACEPTSANYDSASGKPIKSATLTVDGTDTYTFTQTGSTLRIVPTAGDTGGNLRSVMWPANAAAVQDSLSCATWTEISGSVAQVGVALRIRTGPNGRVQAVTATQNVYGGATWYFKVHIWDNAASPQLMGVGTISLPYTFAPWPALPVRFCAKAEGDTFTLKIWPTSIAEPAWGDPMYGGSVTLPASARVNGFSGWYIGHVNPDGAATADHLTTQQLPAPPPAAPAPAASKVAVEMGR